MSGIKLTLWMGIEDPYYNVLLDDEEREYSTVSELKAGIINQTKAFLDSGDLESNEEASTIVMSDGKGYNTLEVAISFKDNDGNDLLNFWDMYILKEGAAARIGGHAKELKIGFGPRWDHPSAYMGEEAEGPPWEESFKDSELLEECRPILNEKTSDDLFDGLFDCVQNFLAK